MADHPDELVDRVEEAIHETMGKWAMRVFFPLFRRSARAALDTVRAWDDEQAAAALYQPDRDDKDQEGAL